MNPLYFLTIVPLLLPLIVLYYTGRFSKDNLVPASACAGGGVFALVLLIWAFTSWGTQDQEVLNGYVTGKEIAHFNCPTNTFNPCENGYDCHCHQVPYECGTDKNPETCYRTECDTCYVYPWEQNYFLSSSLDGDRAYKISRIDKQGSEIPPRWDIVKVSDPVSKTHSYTNYLLNSADSLFAEDGKAEEKYKTKIPEYPISIFDYYHINRLVTVGNVHVNNELWNDLISRTLVQVGPQKQANIVVVLAEGVDMDFANAVRRAWRGFKKNDIVVFAGLNSTGELQWTRTLSWSSQSLVNVKIEDDLLTEFQYRPIDAVKFMAIVKKDSLSSFKRRSMKEFEYLTEENNLSTGQMVWLLILFVILQVVAVVILLNATMYGQGTPARSRYINISRYTDRFR